MTHSKTDDAERGLTVPNLMTREDAERVFLEVLKFQRETSPREMSPQDWVDHTTKLYQQLGAAHRSHYAASEYARALMSEIEQLKGNLNDKKIDLDMVRGHLNELLGNVEKEVLASVETLRNWITERQDEDNASG